MDAYRARAIVQVAISILTDCEDIADGGCALSRVGGAERPEELEIKALGVAGLLGHHP